MLQAERVDVGKVRFQFTQVITDISGVPANKFEIDNTFGGPDYQGAYLLQINPIDGHYLFAWFPNDFVPGNHWRVLTAPGIVFGPHNPMEVPSNGFVLSP